MQLPGSFNIRGIGLACKTDVTRGARRVVSSYGGNAGLDVAHAGRKLLVAVTVVVPVTASKCAEDLLRQENADVIVHGALRKEANDLAVSLVGEIYGVIESCSLS